jgi:hypothetical protein
MWLDDKTLEHLKSISRKLVSAEHLSLNQEELCILKKLSRNRCVSYYVMKYFLPRELSSNAQMST